MEKTFKHGLKTVGEGIAEMAIATGQKINSLVKAYPWVAIFLAVMMVGVPSIAFGLNCLAKENTAEAQLYTMQEKYDSLMICVSK